MHVQLIGLIVCQHLAAGLGLKVVFLLCVLHPGQQSLCPKGSHSNPGYRTWKKSHVQYSFNVLHSKKRNTILEDPTRSSRTVLCFLLYNTLKLSNKPQNSYWRNFLAPVGLFFLNQPFLNHFLRAYIYLSFWELSFPWSQSLPLAGRNWCFRSRLPPKQILLLQKNCPKHLLNPRPNHISSSVSLPGSSNFTPSSCWITELFTISPRVGPATPRQKLILVYCICNLILAVMTRGLMPTRKVWNGDWLINVQLCLLAKLCLYHKGPIQLSQTSCQSPKLLKLLLLWQ